MINYTSVEFDYEASALFKVLEPFKMSMTACTSCDNKTILEIYKLLNINVPIQSILYFKLNPNQVGIIHIDKNLSNETKGAEFALNLPLINSDNVLMRWYRDNESNKNFDIFTGPNGTDTPSLPKDRATCIDQVYYTSPHIVKINDWHSVENESTTDVAHFISLRFFLPLDIVMKNLVRRRGIEPLLIA